MPFGRELNEVGTEQLNMLRSLYGEAKGQKFGSLAGSYAEQARLGELTGATLGATTSGVGGTYKLSPLFNLAGRFAADRMGARNAFEQARIARLLGITRAFSDPASIFAQRDQLALEKEKLDLQRQLAERDDFNIFELIPQIGLNFVNPFGA